jgi:glycosyltransferase involved in cell wall biosynthesis
VKAEPGTHLAVAQDDAEMARLVVRLIEDPSQAAAMGAAARELARRDYSWEGIGDRLLGIVDGALG